MSDKKSSLDKLLDAAEAASDYAVLVFKNDGTTPAFAESAVRALEAATGALALANQIGTAEAHNRLHKRS